MATNAYLNRLSQLDTKRKETFAKQMGLPLNRPLNRQQTGMAGNPMPAQEEQGPDMSSPFAMNLEAFKGQDNRFNEMMQEYTKLAIGFGEAVKQGVMPEVIAKQRLASYLQDSQKYFASHNPTPMDNPQVAGLIEQALMQASGQQGQEPIQDPNAPKGGPQQMPNHEQAGPAIPHGAAPQQGGA